ncbi:hypothetical protein [Pseudonocardia sp. GCM10023141]|uniref:hypothetical protein n=1 Tax=Pseudonocardia sp. GCM10023141 TaxID=3252653 RepID=UPI0036069135
MLVTIAVIGSIVLFGLAVVVGRVQGRSLAEAWDRVAVARRGVVERARQLDELQIALDAFEAQLDRRERRLDYREQAQFAYELELQRLERPDVAEQA